MHILPAKSQDQAHFQNFAIKDRLNSFVAYGMRFIPVIFDFFFKNYFKLLFYFKVRYQGEKVL
jgi:hypothetical protein